MSRLATFEGSFLGDASRIGDDARLECGICWYVYDPAAGDPVWQIPGGTPFAALPDHWRCPTCDAEQHKFMVVGGTAPSASKNPCAALTCVYRTIAERDMRDLPVYNAALSVEAIGFRPFEDGWIGIMVTPWFMNAVLLPRDPKSWDHVRDGATIARTLPSGQYDFVAGRLDGIGPVLSCSLFSPMFEFAEQSVVRLTAEAALAALLDPTDGGSEPAPPAQADLSRRHLLRGSFG
jgi:[NiFe] hydrogenase assembly HybE family chaperone